MEVERFADIEAEFIERVHSMVWCNFATVDGKQRPYSRILHPIWEGSTGWILTHRNSHKGKHLAANPHASLAYVRGDLQKPVYVDCVAEWENDRDEKHPEHENFGLLRLTPWRIVLVNIPRAVARCRTSHLAEQRCSSPVTG